MELFKEVVDSGLQLALMAHFNHPAELRTEVSLEAVRRIRATGAQIRTQTPLLKHINDDSQLLADMWAEQAQAGCVPYYLFVARDTGAKRYFELPLVQCQEIFRKAYTSVSGVARTVRGPSMSATPGKVQMLGVAEHAGEKMLVLRFLQGRDPDWVGRPFFAAYDEHASWLDELRPAGGEDEFFYDERLRQLLAEEGSPWARTNTRLLLDGAAAGQLSASLSERVSAAAEAFAAGSSERLVLPGTPAFICLADQCEALCCRAPYRVDVDEAESARLIPIAEIEEHGAVALMAQGQSGACVLLTDDLRCGAYELRPRGCVQYPYLLHFEAADGLSASELDAVIEGWASGAAAGSVVPLLMRDPPVRASSASR